MTINTDRPINQIVNDMKYVVQLDKEIRDAIEDFDAAYDLNFHPDDDVNQILSELDDIPDIETIRNTLLELKERLRVLRSGRDSG